MDLFMTSFMNYADLQGFLQSCGALDINYSDMKISPL